LAFKAGELMKIGYMCGVDFQCEIDPAVEFPIVYSTIKALKKERTCWVQCGIVEVELNIKKWIKKQNFNARENKC
jgi:hypothetical protein